MHKIFLIIGVFFSICLFCFVPIKGQQIIANDDFYTIDKPQFLEPFSNDLNWNAGRMVIEVPTSHIGLALNNWDPYSCMVCPHVNPQNSNYTGYDSFQYKYVSCCGSPPGNDSNIATVHLIVTANDDAQNAGTCRVPVPTSKGQPVNVTNGNMWLVQKDYLLQGLGDSLEINRFYNSIIQTPGLFGLGWTTKYDESIQIYDSMSIRWNQPDGRAAYFGRRNTSEDFFSFSQDVTGTIKENLDGTYLLTFKEGTSKLFSSNGNLLTITDNHGNISTLSYNGSGHLVSVTDAGSNVLTFTSNSNGTISAVSDSFGSIATYEYYLGTELLKTVTFNDNSQYKFEYTTVGNKTLLTTVKDALNNVLEHHEYDSQARAVTSELHGGVEKYTFEYTTGFLNYPVTIVTDALGNITKYYYLRKYGVNYIFRTEGDCGSCGGTSGVTNYEYDDRLNLTKKTDALGRQTLFSYDSNRNLIQKVEPLGTQKWTYNSFGQVLTYKDFVDSQDPDPNINTVVNTYDASGNLLTSTDALGNTTTLTYTVKGQLETMTDARNKTTELTYDTQGRLTQITDANNKDTDFAYDARARVTSITNALSQTTSFEYDLNNRLKKVTYPDTNFVEYTYDLAGRRTAFKDARGNSTSYTYDNAYRLTGVTDPLNHTVTLGYDLMSNLTSQTDALGNVTDYEYDELNRLEKIIYPEPAPSVTRLEESITYDEVGNVKTRVDTAGRTTSYDYDTSNRLIKITDALSGQTQFEYNLRSQMTKVKDALNQEYVFTYDPLGRVLSQTRAGTTMTFEYDAVGNRTKRTDYNGSITNYTYDNLNRLTQGPLGTYTYDDLSRLLTAVNTYGTVSFTYDNRGRVDTTTDVYGKVIDYDYDANGNRTLMKLDSVNYSGYAYDAANRLTSISNLMESNSVTFTYDDADRLTGRLYPNNVLRMITYDGMSRLKGLLDKHSKDTFQDKQYSYNTANQISQITEPGRTRSFTYDALDRLTAVSDSVLGSESYAYDAVGNRTSSHLSSSYTYSGFNRLTATQNASYTYDNNGVMASRTDANGTINFGHDSDGRLINSYDDQFNFSEYRYDALGRRIYYWNPYQVPYEYTYDGHDVLVSYFGGSPTKYQNGPGIDNKLSVRIAGSGGSLYYLQDHLGTTFGTTDSSRAFSSWGLMDSFGGPGGDFTGREYDSFNQLYYYRARMYDPDLGRFTAEDPIGFNGGDVNLYGYVNNRPTMFRDPSGNLPIIPIIVGGVAIGGLILASPSPVNAPGPCDPVYYPDNPLLLNAAGGQALSMIFGRVVFPWVGRLISSGGDDLVSSGLPRGSVVGTTPPSVPNTPSFLGQSSGPAISVPEGAVFTPIVNPGGKITGFGYTGGTGGGNGLSSKVTAIRIMDPTLPRGPSPGYPNGYVNYMNASGQAVNPLSGQTVARSSPWWHLPLGGQ